jgi:hypothetical protein
VRSLKTLAIVVAIYFTAFMVEVVVASSSNEYQGGLTVVVLLGSLALMAPKVGYRWFDCFFAAVPIYGIFFIFRIAYRIAFLPNRDWSER